MIFSSCLRFCTILELIDFAKVVSTITLGLTLELCSGSHAIAPKNSAHKGFFSFKLAQCFFQDYIVYCIIFPGLYFRISQKVTQVNMRLLTRLRSLCFSLVYEFTVYSAVFKELYHRKYSENYLPPSLKK